MLSVEVVAGTDSRGFKVKPDTSFVIKPALHFFFLPYLSCGKKAACLSEGSCIDSVYILYGLNRIQGSIVLLFLFDMRESLLRVPERDGSGVGSSSVF